MVVLKAGNVRVNAQGVHERACAYANPVLSIMNVVVVSIAVPVPVIVCYRFMCVGMLVRFCG